MISSLFMTTVGAGMSSQLSIESESAGIASMLKRNKKNNVLVTKKTFFHTIMAILQHLHGWMRTLKSHCRRLNKNIIQNV